MLQPYEDDGLLPYSAFSIRLARARLPALLDFLRAMPEERYLALRRGLALHWPAFVWDPARGGRAYNMTVAALKRRATALMSNQLS